MMELLGGAVATALVVHGYHWLTSDDSSESAGCNGHHWGEREPVIDPIPVDGKHAYGSLQRLESRLDSEGVSLRVDAQKTCEDCNETRATTVQVGRVPYEAFRDEDE